MNLNLQLKIKKAWDQASKHLSIPEKKFKTIKFNYIWFKTN